MRSIWKYCAMPFCIAALLATGAALGGCEIRETDNASDGGGVGDKCATAADCEGLDHIECVGEWACESGQCTWNCSSGGECTTDADCAKGAIPEIGCADGATPRPVCKSGSCQIVCGEEKVCKDGSECAAGEVCEYGPCPMSPCAPGSEGTEDCPEVQPCYGKCVPQPAGCTSDTDCPEGYYCEYPMVYGKDGAPVPGCDVPGDGTDSGGSGGSNGTDPGGNSVECIPVEGVCVKRSEEVRCMSDEDCPEGYYCAMPGVAVTDPDTGGEGGVIPSEGICLPYESCICYELYAPVCGTDGVTYGNECFAMCAEVEIAHEGECGQGCMCYARSDGVCGADFACDPGYECRPDGSCCSCPEICKEGYVCGSDMDCPIGVEGWACVNGCCQLVGCACPLYYDPVCGADGNSYGNECEARCAGVEVVYKGECKAQCMSDWDCPQGTRCNADEVCMPPPGCDPSGGMACPDVCYGYCVPVEKECYTDADCPEGYYCQPMYKCDASTGEKCPNSPGVCMPRSPECEPVLCELFCEYGFAIDERGCEICKCNEPPIKCETFRDSSGRLCERCFNPDGSVTMTCSENFCDASGMPACQADADCPIGVDSYACVNGCCQFVGCACPMYYAPVCGKDGRTYGNPCEAKCAGVEVAYEGPCHGECVETFAPCNDDSACPQDYACFEGACCKP
ncbi:MAG: hypothetical protein HY897_07675 [Deltaproteobacteria bacterium]|nr:hypothetical protein [Deltaproteobacteria bacterium]